MKLSNETKIGLLFLGDIVALYSALILTMMLRYRTLFLEAFLDVNLVPFSIIFILWLIVFYVSGLYDLPRLRNNLDFVKTLALVLMVNASLTIALFYLIPYLGIAPKTNLFLFLFIFAVLEVWWRRTFNIRMSFREGLSNVLLVEGNTIAEEIVQALRGNPQLGYRIQLWLKEGLKDTDVDKLHALVRRRAINLIVIPHHSKHNFEHSKVFYELLASGIEVVDMPTFYEMVFRKVPLIELAESWFLENRLKERRFYDEFKTALAWFAALVLIILFAPLMALIALTITLASRGPAVYKQVRVGQDEKEFILYKFRTMKTDAERDGAKWAEPGDNRTTFFGRLLRYTHLDELPQLVNILKGELAFVGPRPERPEFVELLKEKVPYYRIRHLVRPGVTGWAQINYPYGASIEDAYEKFQYELYYLKNRSLVLDSAIILKTLKMFFATPQKSEVVQRSVAQKLL